MITCHHEPEPITLVSRNLRKSRYYNMKIFNYSTFSWGLRQYQAPSLKLSEEELLPTASFIQFLILAPGLRKRWQELGSGGAGLLLPPLQLLCDCNVDSCSLSGKLFQCRHQKEWRDFSVVRIAVSAANAKGQLVRLLRQPHREELAISSAWLFWCCQGQTEGHHLVR